MPRKRRDPPRPPTPERDAAPEVQAELVAGYSPPRNGPDPQMVERRRVVARLVTLGVTRAQLRDALADQGWDVSESIARSDHAAVMSALHQDYEADLARMRAVMVERLSSDLPRLRREAMTAGTTVVLKGGKTVTKPNHGARAAYWRTVTSHEATLARLLGLFAPVKVQVDARLTVRESLLAVVSGMSADQLDELAEEQLRFEEEARRRDGE